MGPGLGGIFNCVLKKDGANCKAEFPGDEAGRSWQEAAI